MRPALLTVVVQDVGLDAVAVMGSGMHTVGTPPLIGMPSAPGYTPK